MEHFATCVVHHLLEKEVPPYQGYCFCGLRTFGQTEESALAQLQDHIVSENADKHSVRV